MVFLEFLQKISTKQKFSSGFFFLDSYGNQETIIPIIRDCLIFITFINAQTWNLRNKNVYI